MREYEGICEPYDEAVEGLGLSRIASISSLPPKWIRNLPYSSSRMHEVSNPQPIYFKIPPARLVNH